VRFRIGYERPVDCFIRSNLPRFEGDLIDVSDEFLANWNHRPRRIGLVLVRWGWFCNVFLFCGSVGGTVPRLLPQGLLFRARHSVGGFRLERSRFTGFGGVGGRFFG